MRSFLALAILLLGLKGAAPEPKIQDPLGVAGANPSSSPLEFGPEAGKANREFVLAVPQSEWSREGHDQQEEAIEPLRFPVPASTEMQSTEAASQSLDDLCAALLTSAQDNDLPAAFFANLIWQESRLRDDAVSPKGAAGIAQFMPETAADFGLDDPFDPRQAIPASARFLRVLRRHFGNLGFAAAAYNAGARRVSEWLDHRRTLPRETRSYVVRVTGRSLDEWRKTPPDDSAMTFVRPLPCRELPAFADLEQARIVQAQQPSKLERATEEVAKPAYAARHRFADRNHAHRPGRSETNGKIARNFRGGRREAARHHRSAYERRRAANAEMAVTA